MKINDMWLFVISMFSEPVHVTDSIGISQIALKKNSCNEVIVPIRLLAL